MNTLNQEAPERQEIEALLPWHAAGTLSRRDAERVERALSGDRELARRFDLVREELHEAIHLNESLGAPSARAAEKLFAAIDAEAARAPARRSFDLAGRIAEFISSFSPRTLAYASGAAALAIMLQAAVLTTVVVKEQGSEASGPMLSSYSDGSAPSVAIRFTSNATAADITKFLDAHKAQLSDGPKRGGFYTLRLTALPSKTEIASIVRQMQGETKIVDFVAVKE